MIMHWPQITFVVMGALGIGIHLAKNGQPKIENYNGLLQIVLVIVELWILYCGGFFG
jgi:hypothetical protein